MEIIVKWSPRRLSLAISLKLAVVLMIIEWFINRLK